jgi:hypothetical protein
VSAAAGNGSSKYDYDIITIGAGSGGVRGSRFASSYGAAPAARMQDGIGGDRTGEDGMGGDGVTNAA